MADIKQIALIIADLETQYQRTRDPTIEEKILSIMAPLNLEDLIMLDGEILEILENRKNESIV